MVLEVAAVFQILVWLFLPLLELEIDVYHIRRAGLI